MVKPSNTSGVSNRKLKYLKTKCLKIKARKSKSCPRNDKIAVKILKKPQKVKKKDIFPREDFRKFMIEKPKIVHEKKIKNVPEKVISTRETYE